MIFKKTQAHLPRCAAVLKSIINLTNSPMPSQPPAAPSADLAKISFAALNSQDPAVVSAETDRLLNNCEECGFFYLVDHDVPVSLLRRAVKASKIFFNLPEETKLKYGQDKHPVVPAHCRGYSSMELLNAAQGMDCKQIFDMGLEREIVKGKHFYGPNVMPDADVAPDFSDSFFELQDLVMKRLVPVLHRALARALSKDEHFFEASMREPTLIQRSIYYPPNVGTAGKHTDNGLFTVLIQEPMAERSLQVYTGGQWVSVEAKEDVFVVNLGDILQFWSSGRFVSTPHQVQHSGEGTRVSLPFFVYPDIETDFEPIEGGPRVRVADVMNKNFKNLWIDGVGAGRARELA